MGLLENQSYKIYPKKAKVKVTWWKQKKKIFQYPIIYYIRLNFYTIKSKERLAVAKLMSTESVLQTLFVKLGFKGRDRLGNENNKTFDYSMFNCRDGIRKVSRD